VQRARRAVRDALIDRTVPRPTRFLAAASIAWAVVSLVACQSPPPTREETAALDYGPRPENYEQVVRGYLQTRLVGPDFAIIQFKTEPRPLYQKGTVLRDRQYGWAACVMVNDKDLRGAYAGFYPMVLYLRGGKVVAANGDGLERAAGVRYAHAQCAELGYEVP
jgi:hypothetical protein